MIAYDGGEGSYASRFWWLLQFLGHEKVFVLNEGFKGWIEADYPTTKEAPKFETAKFEATIRKEMLATYEEVKDVIEQEKKTSILIDSREERRYIGEVEPIDRVAGHIPGAINKFWAEGLDKGSFKDNEAQKKRFAELDTKHPVIVYCGSGVTAAPNYIALKMAGFDNVKLYAGSYSDWVSHEQNPVEKGKS